MCIIFDILDLMSRFSVNLDKAMRILASNEQQREEKTDKEYDGERYWPGAVLHLAPDFNT